MTLLVDFSPRETFGSKNDITLNAEWLIRCLSSSVWFQISKSRGSTVQAVLYITYYMHLANSGQITHAARALSLINDQFE